VRPGQNYETNPIWRATCHDVVPADWANRRFESTGEPCIALLLIGGGKHFEDLAHAVKVRQLENLFRRRPYQERAMLPNSLGVADTHWLSLNPALEGLIVPSKFYAVAAAGKPIVMIGDCEGELGA
jgi:hypothetical protein